MAPKINRTDPFILLFNREMPKTMKIDRKPISKDVNYGPSLSKLFKELKVTKRRKKEVDDDDIPLGAGVGLFIGREETRMMEMDVVTDAEADAKSMKRERLRARKFVSDVIPEMDSDLELSSSDEE